MKKIYQAAAGCLLLAALTLSLFLYKKQSLSINEITFKNHPLNGDETALLISKLYDELGPRIGSHLVEPNAVITFAGLRGKGNFLIHNLTSHEKTKIENLNKKIAHLGIQFIIYDDAEDAIADIYIENLKGAEYASKLSKLPFVEPFSAATGHEGLKNWTKTVRRSATQYFNNEKNELSENHLDHLMVGLQLGYPDQALLDSHNVTTAGLGHDSLKYSKISQSDYYENPEPNFGYLPEHEKEESIEQTTKSWGKLLEDFYNSKWHTSLSQNLTFIKTIRSEKKEHDDWFTKRRLNNNSSPAVA